MECRSADTHRAPWPSCFMQFSGHHRAEWDRRSRLQISYR
jgi:hypothetical protein